MGKTAGEIYYDMEEYENNLAIETLHRMYFDKIILPARSAYYSNYDKSLSDTRRTLCPLHDEDTPSFYYREERNEYKCFGCGASGDIIALHRAFTENETGSSVKFRDALRFLKKVFIEQGDVELTEREVRKKIDYNELTYMNSIYARAFKAIISDNLIDNKCKLQLLWEIRALREFAYEHGDKCVNYVSDRLRQYYKGGIHNK